MKMMQHVFLIGAKSLGAYGGYETFIDKLTEYHQHDHQIKYHVSCKKNGEGCMDPLVTKGVIVTGELEFTYHNADCFQICVPEKLQYSVRYELLWIWFCVIVYLTFLNRLPGVRYGIYLILELGDPFGGADEQTRFLYSAFNVMLFLPLGITLMLIQHRKGIGAFISAAICLILTLGIDILQYVTKRGNCELTDVVCNFAGGLLGVMIVILIRCIRRRMLDGD